ncbi:MAG: DUF115 domain-containing protein [Treponema sp.]|jgi:hypothetical protein|nr:DUF115 domain-containing protein [Treponema sp.]
METADQAARSFWERNLGLVRRLYPGLAEQLEAATDDTVVAGGGAPAGDAALAGGGEWNGNPGDLRLEHTAAGVPGLSIRGLHIHSNRDPAREARRLAESLGPETPAEEAPGPLLVLGLGLGYGAEAAAARFPERPLIIVERQQAVLRKALECRDLSPLLGSQKIVFVIGGTGEGVRAALDLFADTEWGGKPLLVKNRALLSLNENWYGELERRIETWASRQDVNQATLRRFGKRWVRNLSRNMEAIRDLPGISLLENLLAPRNGAPDIPVFLAAAGPSLDRCADLLPNIGRRCLVLAVDTSLRFLLRRGLDPDFVLSVDPQYWNSRHLDRSPAPRSRLVAESAVYPPVLRLPFLQRFLCGSLFPLGRFIEDRVDPKGQLGAGGSVATTAWDFARSLGTRNVWIAGLDLAYPELKTHFRGALFEDRSHAESGRRFPAETWALRTLRDGQPFRAPASGRKPETADGPAGTENQVFTDRRLSLYAAWFEARFRQFPEVRNYRLFPGGLAIRGLEDGSPEALLSLPARRTEIDRRLEEEAARLEGEFFALEAGRRRAERYDQARRALLEGLDRIKAAAEQGAVTAEQALNRPLPPPERGKVLAALDKTLRAVTESEVKDVAGFLFPPPEKGSGGPGGGDDSFRAYLKSSVKLYRSLAKAAEYNAAKLPGYNRGGS